MAINDQTRIQRNSRKCQIGTIRKPRRARISHTSFRTSSSHCTFVNSVEKWNFPSLCFTACKSIPSCWTNLGRSDMYCVNEKNLIREKQFLFEAIICKYANSFYVGAFMGFRAIRQFRIPRNCAIRGSPSRDLLGDKYSRRGWSGRHTNYKLLQIICTVIRKVI